jgi:dipeptidyl aminopeptidase/acylaminoacyl peptidase
MGEIAAKEKAVSPVAYVSKDDPPHLIIHGTADTLVPYAQSVELADALKQAGVEVLLQEVPGAGHGGPQFTSPPVQKLYQNFFDKHLKGAADAKVVAVPASAFPAPQPATPK